MKAEQLRELEKTDWTHRFELSEEQAEIIDAYAKVSRGKTVTEENAHEMAGRIVLYLGNEALEYAAVEHIANYIRLLSQRGV